MLSGDHIPSDGARGWHELGLRPHLTGRRMAGKYNLSYTDPASSNAGRSSAMAKTEQAAWTSKP